MQITLTNIEQLTLNVHAASEPLQLEIPNHALPIIDSDVSGCRLVKLDEQGNELPPDAISFAILRHEPAGLLIDLRRLHTGDHESCMRFAGESTLLGRKWRLITVEEAFLYVADRTRQDPAVNPHFYPMLRSEWIWTSTPDANPSNPSSPVCAWGVNLRGGLARFGLRYGVGLALPVSPLAAPAGQ